MGACIMVTENDQTTGHNALVIAVDGPAASGKGTLARKIARYYGLNYLDTGRLYRAVAFKLKELGGDVQNIALATQCAESLTDEDINNPSLASEKIGKIASEVSAIPQVREALLAFQKQFAKKSPGAVLDGRDIGTVICPDANCKLFITASLQARAKRRFKELNEKGMNLSYEEVIENLKDRDLRDSKRSIAPLKAAEDAVHIDTTALDIEQSFEKILSVIKTRV